MLLLCSCATQRQAEKHFDKHTDQLAAYVDKNDAYTRQYGGAYAARHFPPRFYAPAIYAQSPIAPTRLSPIPMQERRTATSVAPGAARYPGYKTVYQTRTVYLQDTIRIDSLHRELEIESLANKAIRKRLKDTEAERDYWQEMNRKKFWTLIAMAVFGVLYILFKVLADRVRET
ncbi:hypothetical protein OB13_00635 [Pontibacter sp. HJ8]